MTGVRRLRAAEPQLEGGRGEEALAAAARFRPGPDETRPASADNDDEGY
jgi:hypothetical protein